MLGLLPTHCLLFFLFNSELLSKAPFQVAPPPGRFSSNKRKENFRAFRRSLYLAMASSGLGSAWIQLGSTVPNLSKSLTFSWLVCAPIKWSQGGSHCTEFTHLPLSSWSFHSHSKSFWPLTQHLLVACYILLLILLDGSTPSGLFLYFSQYWTQ